MSVEVSVEVSAVQEDDDAATIVFRDFVDEDEARKLMVVLSTENDEVSAVFNHYDLVNSFREHFHTEY